jgi:DNA-binding transcriptional ArsR family regulator
MARNSAMRKSLEKKESNGLRAAISNPAEQLDKLIHERTRLGIISALAANEKLSFNDLKNILSATDGNISVHARKLEEAGYIECTKTFSGRVPLTEFKITKKGSEALSRYLNHMEFLIKAMRQGQE